MVAAEFRTHHSFFISSARRHEIAHDDSQCHIVMELIVNQRSNGEQTGGHKSGAIKRTATLVTL
jgi:hypothetical protein